MAIGALNESPLHAALKLALAPAGARFEVTVDGYVIDAVHEGVLIEVQTGNVGSLRPKLQRLLQRHRLRLVVPVASRRWIVRRETDGAVLTRRRSPKRADTLDALAALVGIPRLLLHPRLEVEVALVHDEEAREHRPGRSWRKRGWVTVERRLLSVEERELMPSARSWLRALPPGLPERFTTLDLARDQVPRRPVAQRAAFVLRETGLIVADGRIGRAVAYRLAPSAEAVAGTASTLAPG